MSPPIVDSPVRVPFAPADVDAVIAFCVERSAAHDAPLLRRLLLDLTSDPAGVIVVRDAGGIALVATVIDRARNGADAADLETLGVRAPLTAPQFARLVVDPAVAFARAGERRALQAPLQPSLIPADGAEQVLRAAGFAHAYDTYVMRVDRHVRDREPIEPLPDGWHWGAVDDLRVDAAHAALSEMFRDAPDTSLSPLPEFRRAVASGATTWRALLEGQRIAGLLQVTVPTDSADASETPDRPRRGEVRTIGRAPAYRGQGLGPRLVRESLRLLALGGAGDVNLTVAVANVRALALYRRFGFEPIERTPVFALALRG